MQKGSFFQRELFFSVFFQIGRRVCMIKKILTKGVGNMEVVLTLGLFLSLGMLGLMLTVMTVPAQNQSTNN